MPSKYRKYIIIFLLVFSQLIGSFFLLSRYFESDFLNDAHSYIEMSNYNFNVTITHRYRFIVPLLAGQVANVFDKLSSEIWKKKRPDLWTDKLGFMLVNVTIISISAVVLFAFLESFGLSLISCFIGLIPFTSSFQTIYAALPSTDSLYLLAIVSWFLALKRESFQLLIISCILGILSKEAFVMFVPMLFWVKTISIPQKGLIVTSMILTYILVRVIINQIVPISDLGQGITNAINHIQTIQESLARIGSIQGVLEVLTVYSFFYIPVVWSAKNWEKFSGIVPSYFLLIFPIVICHILLSSELPRMWLYTFPVICLGVAFFFDGKFNSDFLETKT